MAVARLLAPEPAAVADYGVVGQVTARIRRTTPICLGPEDHPWSTTFPTLSLLRAVKVDQEAYCQMGPMTQTTLRVWGQVGRLGLVYSAALA